MGLTGFFIFRCFHLLQFSCQQNTATEFCGFFFVPELVCSKIEKMEERGRICAYRRASGNFGSEYE